MHTHIRLRGLDASDSLREYIARRAHSQFSRFGRAIDSVTVRVDDVNGPRGGPDKRCHVTVRGPGLGILTLEDLSAEAQSVVDLVFERAARRVGREIERTRSIRREESPART